MALYILYIHTIYIMILCRIRSQNPESFYTFFKKIRRVIAYNTLSHLSGLTTEL